MTDSDSSFNKPIDEEGLAEWAHEHLIYEVDTMLYALESLRRQKTGRPANVAIAAFATSARCLRDFLWNRPQRKYRNDALACHFSDDWNGRRGPIPPNLAEVDDRGRFGQEVFHLTWNRISGADPCKSWPCGKIALEIGQALDLFAGLAREDALDDWTRRRLKLVAVQRVDDNGTTIDVIGTLGLSNLVEVTAATTMVPPQLHGSTINPASVDIGGISTDEPGRLSL
jgi:hypothetical protein